VLINSGGAAGSGSGAQPKQSKRLKKGVITVSGD
jgi:hypothetical protein